MKEEFISIIEDFALKNSKIDDIHGFKHVKRVCELHTA